MSPPACPDQDDLPPPNADEPPGLTVWAIAGCALALVYVIALALLQPRA